MHKLRVAVLISGRGSNMAALIDACAKPGFPAEIAVVISNTPAAPGLARAADAGIPAMIVDHTYFKGDKPAFENALAATIEQHDADLVCLAGFMRILSADFLKRFKDKVINIHPSLLPAYTGLDTHARVLRDGEKIHGCSVHVVTPGMDEGEIIAFAKVKVQEGDTPETLAERVLAEEHLLYPEVVRQIALGTVRIVDGRIDRTGGLRHHKDDLKESESPPMSHSISHHDHPHTPPVADAEAIERSQYMWHGFVRTSVIAGAAIAVTLLLMAAFLV